MPLPNKYGTSNPKYRDCQQHNPRYIPRAGFLRPILHLLLHLFVAFITRHPPCLSPSAISSASCLSTPTSFSARYLSANPSTRRPPALAFATNHIPHYPHRPLRSATPSTPAATPTTRSPSFSLAMATCAASTTATPVTTSPRTF